ncbi:hypothetical protein CRE_28972 [Caenorhabditis remanei]|uniref:Uncharacterized protein n=1 Tax=Caenorhabditis remanei TaxID=31234 RepID=E3N596_CAERE|nr:hypothetical protein CRE_28972 [Caenorhabditis remanei]
MPSQVSPSVGQRTTVQIEGEQSTNVEESQPMCISILALVFAVLALGVFFFFFGLPGFWSGYVHSV